MAVQQLAEIEMQAARIYIEPVGRNTAPPLALAALMADPDDVLLFLPSDQVVKNVVAFEQAVARARNAVEQGYICTFGMQPDHPATGYGYIKSGEALADHVFKVANFHEKPGEEAAKSMLAEGGHYWNGGIFMCRAKDLIAAFEIHAADILAGVRKASEDINEDLQFCRLDAKSFGEVRAESIDYAVMEKATNIAVVPVDMGWTDLGSFNALAALYNSDESGNRTHGDVMIVDSRNTYVHAPNRLVATVGVDDLIIVDTVDALLVAHKGADQQVKQVVERLKVEKREEATFHNKVYRPWGTYRAIANGDGYQSKEIEVYPGKRLSLQMHHQRAEHWIIVCGTAIVTRDDEEFELKTNESVYIPLGAKHRLENRTNDRLVLIEVQSGSYLGEDDIVRFEDDFKRSSSD